MNPYAVKKIGALLILFTELNIIALAQDEKKPDTDLRIAVSQIAKANLPAVVHIKAIRLSKTLFLGPEDSFLRPLFPELINANRESHGMGTGLIMDEQGRVLTNQHLVMNTRQIQVILNNNQRYTAQLLGSDRRTDLAVLQIQGNGPFPHVRFGNSDQLEPGDWVVALGHSPEAEPTVTQGIVCSRHRKGTAAPTGYKDFIQTDAVVNAGNCGGPLLNLKGEVIGINILASRSSRPEGFSLAVPANLALDLAKQLIASEKPEQAWLGAGIQDLVPEQARALGLEPSAKGALVVDLAKNGPADRGGLQKGDVVVHFQNREIRTAAELQDAVADSSIDREIKVVVLRKTSKVLLKVRLGRPEESTDKPQRALKYRLGAEVRALTGQELSQLRPAADQGVLVVWVDPAGPLHEIGLEKGDLILQINGRAVREQNDLAELMQAIEPGQWITLLALDHRSGRSGYIQVVIR